MRVEQIANETRGLLPVLSQLCEQDRSLSKVYLCHPDVQHVVKMAKEGGFCGYRNIQMVVRLIRFRTLKSNMPGIYGVQSTESIRRSRSFKGRKLRATSIFRDGSHLFSSYKT